MITVIGIVGIGGRMGQAIAQIVASHPEAALAGGLTRSACLSQQPKDDAVLVTDNPEELLPHCDVIIDFSHPSATPMVARLAAAKGKPFLSGTTGLGEAEMSVLREAAQTVPVLYAANTSLSLVVTRRLAKLAAQLLKDQDYDVSILDKHHRWKKDAPSGTALTLGQAVLDGNAGIHPPAYASIRSGAIVGEHEVMFAGPGEVVTIHHSVTDRRVFARGAVHAALWLAGQKPGFYGMDDLMPELG